MKKIGLIILLLIICTSAISQKLVAFRNKIENAYNFWLYTPPQTDSLGKNEFPLVIFLHGSSLCGNDMNLVRRYGVIDAIESGLAINSIILAPQNPGGSWNHVKINNLLDWVEENYPVNKSKIYVIGMSLGGFGTLDYVGRHEERIAGAVALCGGSTLSNFDQLNKLPLWIAHGTSDRAVSYKQSQRVVDAMNKCGATDFLIYQKLDGVNHSMLARVFYMPEIYDWLFSFSKSDSLTKVVAHYVIDKKMLSKVYSNFEKSNLKIEIAQEDGKQYVEPPPEPQYYTIKKGDTLGAIAKKYKTTVSQLCKLNKLKETSILQIGKKLRLK